MGRAFCVDYYNKPHAPTTTACPYKKCLSDLKPSLCASCGRGLAVATLLTKLYYVPVTGCSSGVGLSPLVLQPLHLSLLAAVDWD